MSDFDEMNKNETENETPMNREDLNSSAQANDGQNEAKPAGGYGFNDDGTYHYANSVYSSDNAADRNENSNQQFKPDSSAYTGGNYSAPNYTENRQPYQNTNPSNNSQYPYSNAYPYQNRSNDYAYPSSSNGGNNKKKNKGGKIFAILAGTIAVVLVTVLLIGIFAGNSMPNNTDGANSSTKSNVDEIITGETPTLSETSTVTGVLTSSQVYKKVLDSSVGILVYNSRNSLQSEGSGVIFAEDSDGKYTYIVTCAHVIADASDGIIVHVNDNDEYTASVVGYDTRTDIGVLRIEASGLKIAEIGDSSVIAVGDTVYAIGNPGGVAFANSFTNGMVSALDRPVSSTSTGYEMECIQHTAAINPGNSGGALVNSYGQVIGINSMKIVADEYEGMGFAVPSSVFVKVVNEIMANGYVTNRPKLGITYVPASNYESYGMFVAIKGLPSGSIVIYSISEDSSFANTEAQEGDMIVAVNGQNLDESSFLPELIENSNVGDTITLSLIRINDDYSFREFDVSVTLVEDRGNQIIEEETTASPYGNYDDFEEYFRQFFGDNFNR